MDKQKNRSTVPENALIRAANVEAAEHDYGLDLAVVFTSAEATIAALNKAAALASGLNAGITLVVPLVVPYPLPIENPPVLLSFRQRQAAEIAAGIPVATTVRLYLCRDPWQALTAALTPRSLVVVGVHRRWWPTKEKAIAQKLRQRGYEVVLTEVA